MRANRWMSPTGSFLAALLFGALVASDALLATETLARRARALSAPARRLWLAHFAQLILLNVGFLLFAWTRLRFADASLPSWSEFGALLAVVSALHIAVDLWVRDVVLGEPLKVFSLVCAVLLLQFRHAEWSLLEQGPVVFLGSPVTLEFFARNVLLLFGLSWAGLAWRERKRMYWRLAVLLALLAGTL